MIFKQIYLGPYQALRLWVRVNLGVTIMKEYNTLSRGPDLEPLRIWFSVITQTPCLKSGIIPL